MSRLTELKQNLEEYETAELTAGALEDISAMRMQAIRSGFEKNRSFYEGIRELYATVQTFSRKEAQGQEKQERSVKRLFIAVTSNKRFYGALMRDIVDALVRAMAKESNASYLIIGRVGWQYFEQVDAPAKARQMILENDTPTHTEFEEMLTYADRFDRVFVLYPKFINPFRQDVGVADITQSPDTANPLFESADEAHKAQDSASAQKAHAEGLPEEDVGYIFEPEVPAILAFFNAQVKRALFQGVLLEAELARTAARLIHMEEAQEHAHALVVGTSAKLRRETAVVSNAALLETLSGFAEWNTTL